MREDPRLFQQTVDEYNMVHWQPVSEEAYKLYICDLADKIKGEKKMDTKSNLQDSGNRREFETGAVRDICEGKGRCDLLPREIIDMLYYSNKGSREYAHLASILNFIYTFKDTGNSECICEAMSMFIGANLKNEPNAILELAVHFEDGAKKYGEYNWQKGIPTHCYLDSGIRHLLKFYRGDKDERHDRAFLWNMVCLSWTLKYKPELDDISHPDCKE